MRVLFILKKNGYGSEATDGAGGLLNSVRFIVAMLATIGIDAAMEIVTDNNDIDRVVAAHQPQVVFIEALWVVPEKFDILSKLHPTVTWVVRLHSDLPFLAQEGIAFEWLKGYIARGVWVGVNSQRLFNDLPQLLNTKLVLYLPNYYPLASFTRNPLPGLNIGCFGAIRPLKNQLLQAVAAIDYARQVKKQLTFHINGTRTEQGGEAVLKNLRALFAGTPNTLVEHTWLSHDDFLQTMAGMTAALAVSFTETFCIVAADAVSVGTPLVCSDQVPWASQTSVVPTTDTKAIATRLGSVITFPSVSTMLNRRGLAKYSTRAMKIWRRTIDDLVFGTV